jgi:CheY-like chemotaxis protein
MKAHKVVLLVEDLDTDLELMRVAFQEAKVKHRVQETTDGWQAIEYLSGTGIYADRERYPEVCVVITDLNMPRVDGFELLGWLKERPQFDDVPKIVLTASDLEEDRERAMGLDCWEYLVKPTGLSRLVEVVQHVDRDWIERHCPSGRSLRVLQDGHHAKV